jgi:hypothetical protein
MKNTKVLFGPAAFVAVAVVLTGCGSSAPIPAASVPVVQQPVAPPPSPRNPYFDGDGGKGMSLAILAPQGKGLVADQDYLPTVVQGEFVSNFSGYSAISVLDREQLDKQYAELLSGYYENDAEAGMDLGRLTPTEYIMGGSITKTASGYALQIQITKSSDKITTASYSGTCTFAELDNLSGIRRASLDLLQKMGISPTERTRTELAGAAAENHVNAQTALAKGITAQKSGTVVEALSYYYQAASFDSSLLEAANRASVVSTAISSGNIGENVRNDIQRRNEWLKILAEAENYFSKHLPYEIVYDPALSQGNTNYAKETVDLSFRIEVRPTEGFKTINTILAGLKETGKAEEWGLIFWPLSSSVFVDRITARDPGNRPVRSGDDMYRRQMLKKISIFFQLVNADHKVIGASNDDIWCSLRFRNFTSGLYIDHESTERLRRQLDVAGAVYGWDMSVEVSPSIENIVFPSVNANDITDTMTVKIVSINGIDAATITQTGYIKISTGEVK